MKRVLFASCLVAPIIAVLFFLSQHTPRENQELRALGQFISAQVR